MWSFGDSDAAVVQRTLEGHPEAFEPLVFRYQRQAHAVAHSAGLKRPEVDDAVQEAFLQAFRDLPCLQDPARFGPWFLSIVRHVALKQLRKAAAAAGGKPPGSAPAPEPPAPAGETPERADFSEYLWRKVAELPPGTREAIFLYYYEGGSIREVARALGITGSGAKRRLKSGRDLLREKLWRELEDCLRDMLPSTREWRRKGRRLGLILLGSIPAAWASRAGAAAPASGGASLLAARCLAFLKNVNRGGLAAGEKKLAGWMAVGLILLLLASTASFLPSLLRESGEGMTARGGTPPVETAPALLVGAIPAVEESSPAVEAVKPEDAQPAPEPPPPGESPAEDNHGRVLVRVIWGDDRTPAPGVSGMVIPWGSPHLYVDERVFTSGPDGTVLVDHIWKGGATVMLDRGGSTGVQVKPGEDAETVVEVPPGVNVEGVVLDRSGFPVDGARVWVSYGGHTNWGNEVATTLADGTFSVRSIANGSYIAARARGHAPSDLRTIKVELGSTVRVQIRLNGEGGTVAGSVRGPDQEPVALAKVMVGAEYASYTLLDDGTTGLSGPPFLGFTDAEGGFMADSLPAGKTRVAVRAPGLLPLEDWIDVRPGETAQVDLALARGATLTGKVKGPGGEPATGVKVVVGDMRDFLSLKVFSGSGGSYSLAGLPPGEVEVYAERAGWGRASAKLKVEGRETLRWDPVLTKDLEVRGRLVDENGAPLPGFVVMTEEMLGGGARKATRKKEKTDADGRFLLADLSDLSYRILVHEPESLLPCGLAEEVRPGPEELEIEIARESLSSAFLRGTVLDPWGGPAGGAKVICYSALSGYRVVFADKERGEFQVGPVPPGRYRIEVQVHGYPPESPEEEELAARQVRDLGFVRLKNGSR